MSHQSAPNPGRTVNPVDTTRSPNAVLRTVGLENTTVARGFWTPYRQLNRDISIPYGERMFEKGGNFGNLRLAAGASDDQFDKRLASDSDIYKWVEAIGYELATHHTDSLRQIGDRAVALIQAAQDDDGYLMSYYQVLYPDQRWTDLTNGHELYCAGHLFQAAAAYDAATGDGRLTEVALKLVEHIDRTFRQRSRRETGGHPEIELALVQLYRHTGNATCLELSEYFTEHRGAFRMQIAAQELLQNHLPVAQQHELLGHAVRQLYLTAGITDLYLENGNNDYLNALRRQWQGLAEGKIYITGGVGQRHDAESFGRMYELPTHRCYCESCAAIANIMWNWRMLLATGDGVHADMIERVLYNAFLASYGVDGMHFFYTNPLASDGPDRYTPDEFRGGCRRAEWHGTACCPPNIMRMLASLGHYVATYTSHGVQVHQYIAGVYTLAPDTADHVRLRIDTDYPWSGRIGIHIEDGPETPYTLAVRIPAWCEKWSLRVSGQDVPVHCLRGYAEITRTWRPGDELRLELDMLPELYRSHPRCDATRGCAAVMRGPLVYCAEQCDQPLDAPVWNTRLLADQPLQAVWRDDILGGLMAIQTTAGLCDASAWEGHLYRRQRDITADPSLSHTSPLLVVPYFAWANRQPGAMRVWLPLAT